MDRTLYREISRMLEPLVRKSRLVASRAIVSLINDAGGIQSVQATMIESETADDAEHMQPGGLTHVPLKGAEGVYLSIGGVREDGVLLCVSNRGKRVKGLESGETALYSAGELQSKILLKANGDIEILAAGKITIGDGATNAMVLGDALRSWLSSMTVGTPMGPSTPPLNIGAAQSFLSPTTKVL